MRDRTRMPCSPPVAGLALLLMRSRPVLAGILLGLLTAKPHLALLFPIALVCARSRRALAAMALSAVLLALVSLAAFGQECSRPSCTTLCMCAVRWRPGKPSSRACRQCSS